MEKLGQPRFFSSHSASVRSVAFSPTDRHLFCSVGNDGNVCIYHAGRAELLSIFPVINSGVNRHVSTARFTCDGKKILAITTSRRLSVLDTERGMIINSYENCAFSGRERSALATDPLCSYNAVSTYVNGKGMTLYDLRMPLPMDFLFDFHQDPIRDIHYLNDSWPFNKTGSQSLLSLSSNGVVKISTIDGRLLYKFDFNHSANTVVATPEPFGSSADDGFTSALLAGGTVISSFAPAPRSNSPTESNSTEPEIVAIHPNTRRANVIRSTSSAVSMEPESMDADDSISVTSQPTNQSNSSETIYSTDGIIFRSSTPINVSSSSSSSSNSSNNIVGDSNNNNLNDENAIQNQLIREFVNFQQQYEPQQTPRVRHVPITYPRYRSSDSAIPRTITIHHPTFVTNNGSVITTNSYTRSNLHQILAMNFMPIRQQVIQQNHRSSRNSLAGTTAQRTQVSPSQIFFHDRWDRATASLSTNGSSDLIGSNELSPIQHGSPQCPIMFAQDGSIIGESTMKHPQQIWRLRYSSNGAILYACGDGGAIRRYRQYPEQQLTCLGEVFRHRGDVLDLDISPFDDYLVTASKDKTVGLICLGSPNHGWTEYYELT